MLNISIGSKKPLSLPQSQAAEQAPQPMMQEDNQLESSPQSRSPEQQPESSAEASLAGSIEADHFDDLLNIPEPEAAISGATLPPGMLGKDEFYQVFIGAFKVASIVSHMKSMDVNPHDETARAACDAIYDTVAEIPALRFLLQPQGRTMSRLVTIGMFAVPMALNVQAEIAARHAVSRPASGKPTAPGQQVIVPDFDMSGGRK